MRGKRKTSYTFVVIVLLIGVAFWGYANGWFNRLLSSTDDIGTTVAEMLQKKLDTDPTLSPYHLYVNDVTVAHSDGDRYEGIADITYNGTQHQVPVEVVNDGDTIVFSIRPGSFAFVVIND